MQLPLSPILWIVHVHGYPRPDGITNVSTPVTIEIVVQAHTKAQAQAHGLAKGRQLGYCTISAAATPAGNDVDASKEISVAPEPASTQQNHPLLPAPAAASGGYAKRNVFANYLHFNTPLQASQYGKEISHATSST